MTEAQAQAANRARLSAEEIALIRQMSADNIPTREQSRRIMELRRRLEKPPEPRAASEGAAPRPRHVNEQNHQLLNILQPIQGLYDIAKRQDDERQASALEREQQLENVQAGSSRSPWTRIKPLKPSPLDEYDDAVNYRRKQQRQKWVRVMER
jgi:hypothetical protein